MITHYTGSNGRPREIAGMVTEHLQNAVGKLERSEPHRVEEIAAMRAELAKRQASESGQ